MKNRIKTIVLAIFSIICITILVMISYAYFTSNDSIINILSTGDVDIEVSEEFKPPENWDGQEHTKVVKIKNESKVPALIRVAIVPRWVDKDGSAWPGDTSIVTLNYENIIEQPATEPSNKWVYGQDGYYYYNTIVPRGETTTEILNSVSASIKDELKERYKDKTLIVDVKAEAVQATKDAHRETWSNIKSDSSIQQMLDKLCEQ